MAAQNISSTTSTDRTRAAPAQDAWRREQRPLGAGCDFPGCDRHAELGLRMCEHHAMVRLASNGSWVDDSHTDGGHG